MKLDFFIEIYIYRSIWFVATWRGVGPINGNGNEKFPGMSHTPLPFTAHMTYNRAPVTLYIP